MSAASGEKFTPESVEFAWQEEDGDRTETASCWFEFAPIRHVVGKHVVGGEPWSKILGQRLADRLRASGGRVTAADCREFVKAITLQMHTCCSQPRVCRFQDIEILNYDVDRYPVAQNYGRRAMEKILFVLPSGGVAFVRVEPAMFADRTVTVFLTAFLPRHVGWVAPARVAATTAGRYVLRWAEHHHPTGGLLLPEPDDAVTERDEVDSRAIHRRWFRFFSPKTWGFRLQKDGRWAWTDPNPGR